MTEDESRAIRRIAQKIQARARDVDFDARLGLERGGERSVPTYVTEPTSRSIRRIAQKIQARARDVDFSSDEDLSVSRRARSLFSYASLLF